jgi:RNA polymerase sigma factor (sigma-70 family)
VEQIRELILRATAAASRDERVEAYGRVVERFRDMACGYAYSILGDFHLAEDAAQEAFVAAFAKLDQLKQPEAFAGWFRRIVWSACGRFTRKKVVPTESLEAADMRSESQRPDRLAETNELRDEVLKAVRALPDRQREVTTLFYINGYSQEDVADFLDVPVSTVKSRLSASRSRLKERMLNMVEQTLHNSAPDERFDAKVIDRLLARPNLLEIDGHPVQQVWQAIRSALADYEVVAGAEVEDEQTAKAAQDQAWEKHAYRRKDGQALRFQTTTVTMAAIRGRAAPVRLITAGRCFRPCGEDKTHTKAFHMVDGICVAPDANVDAFKGTCERVLAAAVPSAVIGWQDHDYSILQRGFLATVQTEDEELLALGGGVLKPDILQEAGYDAANVAGFAWGIGLDRLAMLRFGLDDIRKLWQPPYLNE